MTRSRDEILSPAWHSGTLQGMITRYRTDFCLIVPHPDDEAFGCGGLFSRLAAHGRSTACITLTRGGAGRTLGLCPQDELPALRERELRAALGVLGVSEQIVLDYPDFVTDGDRGLSHRLGLQAVPAAEIIEVLVAEIERLAPRVVVTFAPNGSNGHPDHVTCNELVVSALERAAHAPEALYYYASEAPYRGESPAGFLPAAEITARHLPPTHIIDVSDMIENKLRALGHHQSQARSIATFMQRYPRRFVVETFHRARPVYPEGEGARTVFLL